MKRILILSGILIFLSITQIIHAGIDPPDAHEKFLEWMRKRNFSSPDIIQSPVICCLPTYIAKNSETNLLTEIIDQRYSLDSGYLDDYRTLINYSPSLFPTDIVSQFKQGSFWQNESQETYHYNAFLMLDSLKFNLWDDASGEWIPMGRAGYTYNSTNQQLIQVTIQNGFFGFWQNQIQYLYTYNALDSVSTVTQRSWDFASGQWTNAYLDSLSYNANAELSQTITKQWNGSAWNNFYLETLHYNTHLQLDSVNLLHWSGNQWTNSQLDVLGYDPDSLHLETDLVQNWDFGTGTWLNYSLDSLFYDGGQNLTQQIGFTWSGRGWMKDYRSLYYYTTITNAGGPAKSNQIGLRIFPNPASDHVIFIVDARKPGLGYLWATDAKGMLVYSHEIKITSTGIQQFRWDINPQVPSGTYLVVISLDKNIASEKLLISK